MRGEARRMKDTVQVLRRIIESPPISFIDMHVGCTKQCPNSVMLFASKPMPLDQGPRRRLTPTPMRDTAVTHELPNGYASSAQRASSI
jgi:hypothetical protein